MARVVPIPVGTLIVDTEAKLTVDRCRALKAAGVSCVSRYVPLPGNSALFDLDATEVQAAMSVPGFGLFVVQHVLNPGWTASSELGHQQATHAVAHCIACGVLPGTTLEWDCEETASGVDAVALHGTSWWESCKTGGYHPMVYEGLGVPFSGSDWFRRIPFEAYEKSMSDVPLVEHRGWCMIQAFPSSTCAGLSVDFSMSQRDYLGGSARMMVNG